MKPVFLLGYMCSGKSTLGCALARALDIAFIDLDDYVEAKAGKRIDEIFTTLGEDAFRALEAEALREVSVMQDAIIACGGGTPCRPGAMDLMNAKGTTVYLDPGIERLVVRLMEGRSKRPLVASIENPSEMRKFALNALAGREAYYRKAQFVFDSSLLEDEPQITQSVNQFISQIWPATQPLH